MNQAQKSLQNPCKKIMASIKLYFDKRAQRKDKKCPLKVGISTRGGYALIGINVLLLPEQWDTSFNKVVKHPNKLFLNNYINRHILDIETVLLKLTESGEIQSMSIQAVKKRIEESLQPEDVEEASKRLLFVDRFQMFMNDKANPRTKELYQSTLNRISAYAKLDTLTFEDITVSWLKDFDKFLALSAPSQNARNIHFRNIRAVFNSAIDDDLITCYPFRKFKIKGKETPKRSLLVEQLCSLRDYPCEEHQIKYRDIFMLSFYLIGINIIDLCHLKHKSVVNGRVEYYRAKTGKFYSVKIEPEAAEILKKYKGETYLLNILDRYSNYKDYAQKLNNNVREIGEMNWVEKRIKGKRRMVKERNPLLPAITTYWARHTWATIAHKVGISKDVISMALGHEFGQKVTGIYIDLDMEKVDEANRLVIDYVNDPVKFMKDRKDTK